MMFNKLFLSVKDIDMIKKYSHLVPKCSKCIGSHPTSKCPRKDKYKEEICINCGGDHTANYEGCVIHY